MTIAQFETNVDRLTDANEWRAAQTPPANVNDLFRQRSSRLDRIAIWVTDHVGTMGFFLVVAAWTAVWLAWNTLGPVQLRFDPAPAFVLWLFVSNVIQLHLTPLIMVGQNLQDRYSELRAEADFEVNQKAEREIETVLEHLSSQNELMLEILRRIDGLEHARGTAV
ncbi:MAG: hypothetical protein QOH08_2571 [Chloroflexota bacterium]|nr:hypothetical protein [Chloroflexota bacterium]